jgi:hypothetical protein
MTFLLLFSLVCIYFQSFSHVNSLRCAHSCAFGPVPFGSIDPIKTPCNTRDINVTHTVCAVLLTVNFQTLTIRGSLNDRERTRYSSSSLLLSFATVPGRTSLSITYTCTTTDDCDQEFLRETIGSSKWLQLNETQLRADISSLLFRNESFSGNVICANDLICSSDANCYARSVYNSSTSSTNHVQFDNRFPCDTTSTVELHFKQQFYTSIDDREETIETHCNTHECNRQETLQHIQDLFRKQFQLPLNYSAYTMTNNRSSNINHSLSMLVLVLIICLLNLFSVDMFSFSST